MIFQERRSRSGEGLSRPGSTWRRWLCSQQCRRWNPRLIQPRGMERFCIPHEHGMGHFQLAIHAPTPEIGACLICPWSHPRDR